MSPSRESAVIPETDLLGDDWFADGTAFESGEALAHALLALAGAAPPTPVEGRPLPDPVPPRPATGPGPASVLAPAARPEQPVAGEFQVAAMPSFQARQGPSQPAAEEAEPTGWARVAPPPPARPAGPPRTGWAIRQSVQVLRITEETLLRLREESAELAWRLASAALRETDR